jgi:hypothetical protein
MKLSCLSLAILVLLAGSRSLLSAEKEADADYYPLIEGYEWTYDQTEKISKATNVVIEKIIKVEKDEPHLVTLEANHGKQVFTETLSLTKDGVLRHEALGKKITPPMLIIKFPIKDKDSWTTKFKIDGFPVENKWTYSKGKVKVPAGEYDAIGISVKNEILEATTWYASGVGKVKQSVRNPLQDSVLELKSFKKP